MKAYQSLKRGLFWKYLVPLFTRACALSVDNWLLNERNHWGRAFSYLNPLNANPQNGLSVFDHFAILAFKGLRQKSNFAVWLAERSSHSCSVYLKDHHLFQTFVLFRSSHPDVFLEKRVLKICSKLTGEHPCQSAISIKLLCKILKDTYFGEHLFSRTPIQMAAFECFWCNKVLPYLCSIKIWKHLIKRTCFIKTCSFPVLECFFQFNDNFLHGVLLGDIFVTK